MLSLLWLIPASWQCMTETPFDPAGLTELPFGLPGRVFRSPMPFGSYDARQEVLERALQAGISVVVDLVPDEEARLKTGLELRRVYHARGLRVIYAPVTDFSVPGPDDLRPAVRTVLADLQHGEHVLVHCNAGFGRTGLFLACLARQALSLDGPQAVRWVRKYVPTALENELQVAFVENWWMD